MRARQARDRLGVRAQVARDRHTHHARARGRPAAGPSARPAALPGRADRHHHVRGLGQLARRHLPGDLEARLHVAEHAQRARPARGEHVGPVPLSSSHGSASDRPALGAREVERGARGAQPLELGGHVLVHRAGPRAPAPCARPCSLPYSAAASPQLVPRPPNGEDRAPAPLRLRQQPLELAHLVPAPGARAERAVVLDPHRRAPLAREPFEQAHRRRALAERKVRQPLAERRVALVEQHGR